jgi:hypothetical protein
MTKGRLDKKQRLADQCRKRAQAATGLAQGAKKPVLAIKVPTAAKRAPAGLSPAHYPAKRSSLGERQMLARIGAAGWAGGQVKKLITVRQALEDPAWLGSMLGGESFAVMRTLLIAAMGEALTAAEMLIFTELTGRTETPGQAVEELWVIAGRRSGKTRAIGTLAAYLAGCCDYRAILGPGERGVLPIMAANTLQAGQCYNFIRGIFTNIPRFAALVEQLGGRHGGITTDTISLKNRIDIQVRPASFRTIRGITAIGVIGEECSMWQSDDSRNPDREILAAARPCLATTGGTLFAIGSPHARKGETFSTYNKHFGANGNPAILVANGPTTLFNPTIKQSVIDRAYEGDPAVAASEWGGQFRNDLESYVNPEIVDACTARGVHRLDFFKGVSYIAHVDPSGGSQDSFTCAIGHVEGDVGVLDVLLEKRPPFISGIDDVVLEFCSVLREYGLHECVGDRYAAGFTVEAFRKHGVEYRHSDMTTSDYFSGFLPILNSRRARLLDHKRLAAQLCSLERRPSRIGAKDSISHPFGGHDDCAAAVAGLMVRLVGTRDFRIKSFHPPVVGPGRSEWIAAGGFGHPGGVLPISMADGVGGSTEKPGGWPAGSPQAGGLDAQLGWSINH